MRKRRAIIYDDDKDVGNMLKEHFLLRGYEALTYQKPVNCPAYLDMGACHELHPCADIILADMHMPDMSGVDMLRIQSLNGCRVPAESKAIMSGALDEQGQQSLKKLGCMYFQKPFSFGEIAAWLDAREQHMDLSQPLGMRRKEKRAITIEAIKCLVAGSDALVEGTVLNRSSLGLCVRIKCSVSIGQAITVDSGLASSSRTASVQWVRDAGDGSYVTGLKYA